MALETKNIVGAYADIFDRNTIRIDPDRTKIAWWFRLLLKILPEQTEIQPVSDNTSIVTVYKKFAGIFFELECFGVTHFKFPEMIIEDKND